MFEFSAIAAHQPPVSVPVAVGIDQKIDSAVEPIANVVEAVVFYAIPIGSVQVPMIIIWLSVASVFITWYLRFQPITGLRTSIGVIRGRYTRKTDPTGEGVAGGVVGVAIVGIQRALFSNAGGVGTAATAHSASKTTKPATEGFVAMWEPLVDSVIICTLTSLAIIVSGSYLSSTSDGIALTADAFRTVSDWFPVILTICAVLFAYSTLLSYCYYGQKALGFLSKDSPIAERIFQVVWVVSIAIGASVSFDAMMRLADSAFFLMSVPNIIGVYFLSRVVRMEILRYRKRRALGIIQEIEQEDLQVGMGDHEPSAEQIATAEEGRRRKRDRMREVRSEFRRARSERMVRKSDKAEYKATGHVAEVTEAEVLDPRTPDLDSAEHEPRDQ